MSAVEDAVRLARNTGYRVLPCDHNKAPMLKDWQKLASNDEPTIRRSWRDAPLIGVATGHMSGFDVLDVDSGKHADAAQWWGENRSRIGSTRIYQTRSGGLHCYFRHFDGVRNRAGIAPHVDVRGSGGQVIHWFTYGCECLDDSPIANWPDWLLVLAFPPKPPPRAAYVPPPPSGIPGQRYAEAALHNAISRVATAPEGARNDTLNREAWGLFRLVPHQLSSSQVIDAMTAAAAVAGLRPIETIATIQSAMRRMNGR